MDEINIIGLGYIGLPTALSFANNGIKVIATDYNKALVSKLNNKHITFDEYGLKELFESAIKRDIVFDTNYACTDLYLVAVPTPYDKFSKKIEPSFVINAVTKILQVCKNNAIIIIESTISPGTIDKYIRPLIANVMNKSVNLVHAPERIIPGNMIYELSHNSRTIGADNEDIGQKVAALYRRITSGEVIVTNIKTAEMTKVVENTFRAVNIAFANELAKICRHDNMDVYEIIKICNMHPRVKILNPGPGVGGHCIPVDPWFLVGDYPSLTKVINESLETNESMPEYVLERAYDIMKREGINNVKRVGIYGLTYKENVDDYRESPTLQLLDKQAKHLSEPLKVFDPWVKEDIVDNQYHNFDDFISAIDFLIVMVKHTHIIDNKDKLIDKIIFDTQNVLDLPKVYKL